MNSGAWQTSAIFSGLAPNTTYSFQARKTETATHFASDPSTAAQFITNPIPVTGVTLNKSATTLIVNNSEQLTATILPANATNQNVSWSSTNSLVATVSTNGTVTALGGGIAIIAVITEDGNKAATCTVTVSLGGNSLISGYVGWENGSGKSISQKSVEFPAEDINVYLQKQQSSNWSMVAVTFTNTDGYFEFRTVPAGRYRVILDIPGLIHDNPHIIEITDRDTIRNIEYVITEDGIISVNITTFTKEDNNLRVYPNPTSGQLTIENGKLRIENVEVFNVMGQKQKIIFNYQLSTQIDISHLQSGIYFLRVGNETVKVVKQ